MTPKIGSKWWGGNDKSFRVESIVELEGKTWVHYIELGSDKKYSCYLESFLERFKEIPV